MLPLIVCTVILAAVAVVLLIVLLLRKPEAGFADRVRLESDRLSESLRAELRLHREEAASGARQLREELTAALRSLGDSLAQRLTEDAQQQVTHLHAFSATLADASERTEGRINEWRTTLDERLLSAAGAQQEAAAQTRQELHLALTVGLRTFGDSLNQRLGEDAQQQLTLLRTFSTALTESSERSEGRIAQMRATLDERLQAAADAQKQADAQTRQELQLALKNFGDQQSARLQELAQAMKQQVGDLTVRSEAKLEQMRTTVESKLAQVQADNAAKLESIRVTVDEKLHKTLEERLGDSFRLVSERLEQVHSGLGEMKSLAVGVGDLKKILSNVKTRGTWGEVQLGNLLEQTLTPEQYVRNFAPNEESAERVEFAIKLPGRDADGTPIWLPLDSKFPHEEYQRLLEAQERADADAAETASAALEQGIRNECRKISEKYLRPPITTDFAILFLPTEGLFAEVLRRPGLSETLQREYRVVVSGPTTLTALLTSLQMGFRTLAIEQRSSEVWKVLGAVKTEFGKFGDALDKVQKKLNEASNSIEGAQRRSRAVARKLKPADELPLPEAVAILGLDGGDNLMSSNETSDAEPEET